MLTKLHLTLCFLLAFLCAFSQIPREKDLEHLYAQAENDETRIAILGQLAELYSIYRDNQKADSVLEKQMLLAEVSRNEERILKSISGKAIDNIATWSSKETFDRATTFLQKGLNYAKEHNNQQLEAIAHLKLAGLYRKRNLFDKSLEQVTQALLLLDKKQDSLKAVVYFELGDAFLGKGDAVTAYKNYNNAYDLSYKINNIPLQSAAWHRFAKLYFSLGDSLLAKNALLESLQLNSKINRPEGLLADYTALFRQSEEIEFLNRAMTLANSLGSVSDQLLCKRLMLSYIMVIEKNSEKALAYLRQNKDLTLYKANEGLPNYNLGAIYHYAGHYAQAIQHYLLDEPLIVKTFDPSIQLSFFSEIADCYTQLNQTDKAIFYFEKAYRISASLGSPSTNMSLTSKLSRLYSRKDDFKNAYKYTQLSQNYNDELKKMAKQREVTLLGLEREKKKHEKDLQDAAEKDLKRRNLQYIGISLGTVFLFIIMLIFGMFPVSKLAIRMLNFFAFICLFEFIILLIDNWLHHAAHGEPLKIWLAKIFIIAILLPLHHYMEHVGMKFLDSQKLIRFRQQLSLPRFWRPSKKTLISIEKNLEESTLV